MNTRKIKEIVKFNVEKDIQNKWFIILNIVVFIGILIATNWSNISKYMEEHNVDFFASEEITIQVLDKENLFYDSFKENCKDYENIKIERVENNSYSKENVPEDNTILFEIKSDKKDVVTSKIVSKEGIDSNLEQIIYDTIKETRSKLFAKQNDITVDELNILNEEPTVDMELLGVDAENSDTKEVIKLISIVVVYMVLIFVLSRIASEIAQEKVSKSIEYVLTSVSEKEYLISKVLSATITILIQVLYTFVYYMIGNLIASLFVVNTAGEAGLSMMANVDTSIITYVIVMAIYLIFTVFLTTLIQAALSAKTTSVAEAGNTTMLLMFVIIVLYFISIGAISPYTTVTPFMYIVSCLPLVSTFFVPSMMIIGQATTLQIIISFVVLIATVPLIFNTCAKHFKNGILDYTSKKKKGLFAKKEKEEISLKEKQAYELKKTKAKKFAFTIGIALILLIVLQVILAFISGLVLPSYLNGKLDNSTILVIENAIISILTMGLAAGFINIYTDAEGEKPKELTSKNKFEIIFVGIGLLAIVQFVLSFIYEKVGLDYNILESFSFLPGNGIIDKIIYVVGLALIPAIFEELLFRKAILNYSKKFGNVFAVLFSAILFGLIHMNLNQGIFAFLMGLIFAVIAVKTSSIKLTVLLHFLNNLYAAMLTILEEESLFYGIFNNIMIALIVVGIVMVIKNIPKLKNIKKEDLKLNKDCLMLIKNYTFIIAMLLIIVMFVVTENMIRI